MKRILFIVLSVTLLSTMLVSCSQEPDLPDWLDLDLVINLRTTNTPYILSKLYSEDKEVEKNISLSINGTEEDLVYRRSEIYDTRNSEINRVYYIDGGSTKRVEVDTNGKITGIYYAYTSISIDKNATAEEIYEPLVEEVSKMFDVSIYTNYEVIHSERKDEEEGFGQYFFNFYNEIYGFTVQKLWLCVEDNGDIRLVELYDVKKYIPDSEMLNINEEKAEIAVKAKIEEYIENGTNHSKSLKKIGKMSSEPVIYNDCVYIHYSCEIDYHDDWSGDYRIEQVGVLVPVSMIKN